MRNIARHLDWRLYGSLALLAGALAGIAVLVVVILRENTAPAARASASSKTPLIATVRTPPAPVSLAPATSPAMASLAPMSAPIGSPYPPSQPSAAPRPLGGELRVFDAEPPTDGSSAAPPSSGSPRTAMRQPSAPRYDDEVRRTPAYAPRYDDEVRRPSAHAPAPAARLAPASPVERFQAAPPPTRYPAGVLTGAEIARIKSRLRLTPEQEPHWRPLEPLLRDIGQQQMANVRASKGADVALSSEMTSRLYTVAGPLLNTLRPDQKDELRRLARSMGLTNVASMI